MDIYVCDVNWKKTDPIEAFESVVWTDRYNDFGDVTLTLPDNPTNRALVTEGIFLHCPDSPSIMIIETINIKEGKIVAVGTDLVYFLRNRIFRVKWQETQNSTYVMNGLPAWYGIYAALFYAINPASVMTGGQTLTFAQGNAEAMPNIAISGTAPPGTHPNLDLAIPYGDLFSAVKYAADSDALGFQLIPTSMTDGTGNMTFNTYRGLDRTTSQLTNPFVIFDPAMDNLVGVEELRDISGYKNVAWVWPTGITGQTQIVPAYAPGAATLTYFQRRTMMVIADDVNVADYTAANLAAVLKQRGLDALANNNYSKLIDGQIVPQSMYKYGVDYGLGDVVELRGALGGATQKARITEYIRSQDPTGEKAYPTLQVVA